MKYCKNCGHPLKYTDDKKYIHWQRDRDGRCAMCMEFKCNNPEPKEV